METEEGVRMERGLVGAVRAQEVTLHEAAAGAIAAAGDVIVTNGGFGAAAARGNIAITNGGCGQIATAGSVSIVNGGCQWIAAVGGATLGERSYVGAVLSPKVQVDEGATVLFDLPRALAFGAALGVVFGVIARMGRRGA